ncbi:hypothetical protein CEXT_64991 [Caerostris extrusa]|uniref:Uncharacterized protein n=1 Tax=Caerostris extrusa TaxID=172846 RepID=A0AAV4N898_CAEEX|nr:hypothetical protein CEXT_64991 [Caerostris extrusa]
MDLSHSGFTVNFRFLTGHDFLQGHLCRIGVTNIPDYVLYSSGIFMDFTFSGSVPTAMDLLVVLFHQTTFRNKAGFCGHTLEVMPKPFLKHKAKLYVKTNANFRPVWIGFQHFQTDWVGSKSPSILTTTTLLTKLQEIHYQLLPVYIKPAVVSRYQLGWGLPLPPV